jgi:hypothetical protein
MMPEFMDMSHEELQYQDYQDGIDTPYVIHDDETRKLATFNTLYFVTICCINIID